ncbi:hypothetical protein MTR_8g099240 [Medicago truncatula]|uniref:Cysteine alpha-hairpin motif superfamily n=1 Tax=Medicago truncatula TaxID=3880 RepID=A0A072TWC9_MEDTR|nr:hypothetical protein MTR_8g099240 [Medicago truncatula]
MDEGGAKPVCGQEALDLLNCVTDSPSYDKDKCLALLNSLRECVLSKVLLFLSVTSLSSFLNLYELVLNLVESIFSVLIRDVKLANLHD